MSVENKSMKNEIKLVLGMSVFGLLAFLFATVALIIFPAWFIAYSVENGIIKALATMFASSLIIGLVLGLQIGLLLFTFFAPLVLVFHYIITNNKSYTMLLLSGTIVLIVGLITIIGIDTIKEFANNTQNFVNEMVKTQLEIIGTENLTKLELNRLRETLNNAMNLSLQILPGMSLILAMIVVYLNSLLAGRMLLKKSIVILQPPPFSLIKLPSNIVFGAIVTILAAYIAKPILEDSLNPIILNLILVFGALFFLQGMAVLNFYLLKFKVPRFFRYLIYIIVIGYSKAAMVISILGILDCVFNFRRIIYVKR
ncbi:MAG: DUF2232 domain-containing protein [Tissierellia bacterium]|nr:DUF2232 domain-containing protein [Tissierellia bacterium]